MAVTITNIIASKLAESVQVTQYTATNCTCIIDKFTVTNVIGVNAVFSVNLVIGGGSAGINNLILNSRTITPGETYTCPELVGHVLNEDSFISTLADTPSALTIRASGREIT